MCKKFLSALVASLTGVTAYPLGQLNEVPCP